MFLFGRIESLGKLPKKEKPRVVAYKAAIRAV